MEIPTDKFNTLKDADGKKLSAVLDINGSVSADGGLVQMTVADASDILRQVISLSGIVTANTVDNKDGMITIGGGTVNIQSKAEITANANTGNAGKVTINSQSLNISGKVSATANKGKGGVINVELQQGASLNASSSFDVSGKQAGKILFIGGLSVKNKGYKVLGSGDFIANSTDGQGGYIDITHNKGLVGLFSGKLSAKGTTRGGRIRIGGAFQGGAYNPTTSKLDTKAQDLFVKRWG